MDDKRAIAGLLDEAKCAESDGCPIEAELLRFAAGRIESLGSKLVQAEAERDRLSIRLDQAIKMLMRWDSAWTELCADGGTADSIHDVCDESLNFCVANTRDEEGLVCETQCQHDCGTLIDGNGIKRCLECGEPSAPDVDSHVDDELLTIPKFLRKWDD